MVSGRDVWLLLPGAVRRVPADLAAVVAFTFLTLGVVFVPVVDETILRVVFGLVFVLFVPGYAFVALLFPEAGKPPISVQGDGTGTEPAPDEGSKSVSGEAAADEAAPSDDGGLFAGRRDRTGIDGIERAALSFGLSIAIVPLVGFVMDFTTWGFQFVPVLTAITMFTLGCTALAVIRRWNTAPENRFRVPYREWIGTAKADLFNRDDRIDSAMNVALALSILLAVGGVTYAVAVPPQGETYTEFQILTEGEYGDYVADGYPEAIDFGDSADVVIGVSNSEHRTEEYTVVVQLQEVDIDDTNVQVHERDELDRFSLTLEHDESSYFTHSLEPTMVGEDLRVVYLLYKGDAPDEPTRENSYRDLHIWIDVAESEE